MVKFKMINIVLISFVVLTNFGCDKLNKRNTEDYLLKSGDLRVFIQDFNRIYEIEKSSIEYNDHNDAKIQKYLKLRALKQLKEELVIWNIANEKNIKVSDQEVEKQIEDIKQDYPDDSFDQMLIDQVISFNIWKEDLRKRMLIEKVIQYELEEKIEIDPVELSNYYKSLKKNGIKLAENDINNELIRRYRTSIAEKKYQAWIDTYQKKYVVEVNTKVWNMIAKDE